MIILVGASASGKTEVAKMLFKLFQMRKVVTHTTRPMRKGEKNGIDYHFVDEETFNQLKDEGYFVETTVYNENYYGTSKLELGDNKVLIVDPNGLNTFVKLADPHIVSFFMEASKDTRRLRMIKRGDDFNSALQRIATDDIKFDPKKIVECDHIINAETSSIKQIAVEVYEIYAETIAQL